MPVSTSGRIMGVRLACYSFKILNLTVIPIWTLWGDSILTQSAKMPWYECPFARTYVIYEEPSTAE